MNRLSIIIPTFRRTDSLIRLLQALLDQKNIELEIIIVDQNQPGYLNNFVPERPNIKHIFLDQPNASTARNKGFLASSGEYILFIDDDLVPTEDFCFLGTEILVEFPAIGCFSPLVYNALGKELALQQASVKMIHRLKEQPQWFTIKDTISAAIFFKRSYFVLTGGFDPGLFEFAKTAEDQELFLRMRKRNLNLYFIPTIEIFHDETVPGGCELRTADYWITREKCIKSWVFRYRIHQNPPGKLSVSDLIKLSRSAFLNRETILAGIGVIRKQIGLLQGAINSSALFLKTTQIEYPPVGIINHLLQIRPANEMEYNQQSIITGVGAAK